MSAEDDELDVIWTAHRSDTLARAESLVGVAVLATKGSLDESQRLEGVRNAHMLAGSVAIFGFEDGARAAKEIEALLLGASGAIPTDVAERFHKLALILRADLERQRPQASGGEGTGTLF